MGMHFGLIAAKVSLQQLRENVLKAWPKYELAAVHEQFVSEQELFAWTETNAESVSAAKWSKDNPGRETFIVCEDGPWAVVFDESFVLAGDVDGLQQLS